MLYEDGRVRVRFIGLPDTDRGRGRGAGVGIEDPSGTVALLASWDTQVLRPGLAIEFRPAAGG